MTQKKILSNMKHQQHSPSSAVMIFLYPFFMPPSIKVKDIHNKRPETSLRIELLPNERIREIQILTILMRRAKAYTIDLSIYINTPQCCQILLNHNIIIQEQRIQ